MTSEAAPGKTGAFLPYLSRLQLDRICASASPRSDPAEETLFGALLFLDAAGFTRLTRSLDDRGPGGAEVLADVLRTYFGAALDTIRDHGGDALFFAGDAVTVLWRADSGMAADLSCAAARAAACALALQHQVREIDPPHGLSLAFRASLGAGGLVAYELGGLGGRWLQLVRGQPLHEVRCADRQARAGEVACGEAFAYLLEAGGLRADRRGPVLRGFLTGSAPPLPTPCAPRAMPAALQPVLADYVPGTVADRLLAGLGDDMAEFRQVSVVFINVIGHADPAAVDDELPVNPGLDRLHEAVCRVQDVAARYGGVVDQLLEDDKGASIILAFGLPGASHSDDAVRAVAAARDATACLTSLELRPAAGIATGPVFCCVHGGEWRRHYSLLGSTINLSARLMQEAEPGGVLCDETTRAATGARFSFVARGTAMPKGFDAPIDVFVPVSPVTAGTPVDEAVVIGRGRELRRLEATLRSHLLDPAGVAVVVEAEAGMGKSTLVAAFALAVADSPVAAAHGAADSLESGTAYYVFRDIVRAWFGITRATPREVARTRVLRSFDAWPEFTPLAPLLDDVLGLDIPPTDYTRQLEGQVRAENLQRLLLHVARECADDAPLLLFLEDGHWIDSASWSLLARLMRAESRLMLVLTTRPMTEPPVEFSELKRRGATETLPLAPLSGIQSAELVRRQIGVPTIPTALLDLVHRRAEGNPFFVRELVRSLFESGSLRVRGGICEFDGTAAAGVPATLEGVITARIDNLRPEPQLTLKVASVIGREFEDDLLRRVHPSQPDAAALGRDLAALRAAELVVTDGRGGAAAHAFSHALTHETTYGLLPFARRETLHRAAALSLETLHADNPAPVHARLAHHFRLARMPERAVPHLAGAGEQALNAYASPETIRFLGDALELDHQVRGHLAVDLDRARWSRLIAQAWYYRDDYTQAREWFERAIRTTGTQPRLSPLATAGALAGLLVGGAAPRGRRPRNDPARERLVESVRSMRELSTVLLWEADRIGFALNTVNMARIAHRLGASTESPYAIGIFAYMLSLSGLRRRAEREAGSAMQMAEETGELLQIAATGTAVGMVLTNHGKLEAAIPPLERAEAAAEEMRAGLYKHRAKFMLAETLFWLGRYERAERLYDQAVELSLAAEPHVAGLANAMVALTLLRRGRVEEALARLDRPDALPLIRRERVALSVVCGLGVLAEARLAAGDPQGALDAVREGEDSISPADDATNFFAGIIGHASLARVRLETGALGDPQRDWPGSARRLDLAFRRIRKIARMHPGGQARLLLLRGQYEARERRPERARRLFGRALAAAEAFGMPYETGHACFALAALETGDRRVEHLRRAVAVFEETGLRIEHERAALALRYALAPDGRS